MRFRSRFVPVLALAAAFAGLGACSSDDGSGDPLLDGGSVPITEGDPVSGNVHVTLRTWDPESGSEGTFVLVNESSEVGTKLRSGRASSTVTRVLDDHGMGSLLATMDEIGFSGVAADGVTLASLPPDPRRRGVIIVEWDGAARGLAFGPSLGRSVATIYRDCKVLLLQVHGSIPGAAVSAGTGEADPSRTFQGPRIEMKR